MIQRKVDKDTALNIAFFHAARNGQMEVVELALEAGVDVHFLSDVALRGAAETGQTEMVGYLLRHGADVHAKNDEPLQLAKKYRHRKTAALLKEWMKYDPPA